MIKLSPLDAAFWGAFDNNHICEFDDKGELVADWHKLRECYDLMRQHKSDLLAACEGDSARVGRLMIGAAIWKARNT
mgnify:CR=1 FL=1